MNSNIRRRELHSIAAPHKRATFSIFCFLGVLCVGVGAVAIQAEEAGHQHAHGPRVAPKSAASAVVTKAGAARAKFEIPSLPEGVSELKFNEFFVTPVGVRGLEVTDKLQRLDGRRVRVLGYMVHQEEPPAGRFLFTPMPAQIHEHDNGLADDLPASTLYVSVPTLPKDPVPHVPGLMLLTGKLSVGNMAEPDGRISVARLALDPPDASIPPSHGGKRLSSPSGKGAERLMSTHSRTANVAP